MSDPYRESIDEIAPVVPPPIAPPSPPEKPAVPLSEKPLPPQKTPQEGPEQSGLVADINAIIGRDNISVEERARAIRTFHGDVEETVRGEHLSLASIALRESRRRAGLPPETPTEPEGEWWGGRRTILLVAGSATLIIVGLAVLTYVILNRPSTSTEMGGAMHATPILTNATEYFSIDELFRDTFIDALSKTIVHTSGTLGTITDLIITKKINGTRQPVSAHALLEILEIRAPSALIRALDDRFMFGVHIFDNNEPFLLLSVNSYDQAFAGMLTWESFLPSDLPLFVRDTPITATPLAPPTASSTASSTPPTRLPSLDPVFTDMVIKNHDARVLLDTTENIRMVYSFFDQKTLVITTNKNTLTEVFDRLTAARFRQ